VLFESPKRVLGLVEALAEVAPERPAAVCRDLTKRTEAVVRGPLRDLAHELGQRRETRGEYVIIVAGADVAPSPSEPAAAGADLEDFIRRLLDQNCPTAPIVAALQSSGLPRRAAYALVQGLRQGARAD
jgi:16S rRNA (cytidine1402-2'-O)-methyltransferase